MYNLYTTPCLQHKSPDDKLSGGFVSEKVVFKVPVQQSNQMDGDQGLTDSEVLWIDERPSIAG